MLTDSPGARARAALPGAMAGKWPCEVAGCGKAFSRAGLLKNHQRTHTSERPYACEVAGCGKVFTEAGNLKRHQRTHSGERPYRCEVAGCGKAFFTSGNLKSHQAGGAMVHTRGGSGGAYAGGASYGSTSSAGTACAARSVVGEDEEGEEDKDALSRGLSMAKHAILGLREPRGSSLAAIKKFLELDASKFRIVEVALATGLHAGFFVKNKGKGTFKLSAEEEEGEEEGEGEEEEGEDEDEDGDKDEALLAAKNAIISLRERAGSSLRAIKTLLKLDASEFRIIKKVLAAGVKSGIFVKNNGMFKLSAKGRAPPPR